jgi:hypothetical protein
MTSVWHEVRPMLLNDTGLHDVSDSMVIAGLFAHRCSAWPSSKYTQSNIKFFKPIL